MKIKSPFDIHINQNSDTFSDFILNEVFHRANATQSHICSFKGLFCVKDGACPGQAELCNTTLHSAV